MYDDIAIRFIDLPASIRGFVVCDADDYKNVYVNARLSYDEQKRVIAHELAHIRNNDFYNDDDPLLAHLGIQPMPTPEARAYWKPYSCRHTFANLMKNVEGSDTDKAALMGHADASMTKYYQSADFESIRRITNAI